MTRSVLLLDLAALSPRQITATTPNLAALAERGALTPLVPPLGALTCPSQISMLTGAPPARHGIVANGWYDRAHGKVFNWNRSARLIDAPLLFDTLRERAPEASAASLFWRHAAHSSADLKVIERPTYWASGKKSFDFYTEPGDLHRELHDALGAFPFPSFWGPLAGWASTGWILDLTAHILQSRRPTLTTSYAPFLDYDGQRYGPDDPRAEAGLTQLDERLGRLFGRCREWGVDVAVVSDYGFVPVRRVVFPNRHLRAAGFIVLHDAANGEILEPAACRAFAHCDNQVAHVYVHMPDDVETVATLLRGLDGVARVLDREAQRAAGIDHPRAGDLIALAERDAWFAYPYWTEDAKAPDFARCIAIFDKPGFDPCELFAPPGLGGKLHLGRRVIEKKLSLAVPFDVIDPDPTRIGGARNADPTDLDRGAVLITSWSRPPAGSLPMEAVHDIVLKRILDG